MAQQLISAGLPSRARVNKLDRHAVLRHFHASGLYQFAHHSGLGGYSKLLLPELLPADVDATLLVDTDTVFVSDLAPLWALRHRLSASGGVLAAKRLATGGACLRGQRINSGVVLMDVRRMRALNWTRALLTHVARLGRPGTPARLCGKMVRGNGTLAAGDQELLSFACLQAGRSACHPMPPALHQDKCDGFSSAGRAVVLHFNCRASVPADCPTSACTRLVGEFNARERHVRVRR